MSPVKWIGATSNDYPRPIAWGLSEVDRTPDPEARFHRLLQLAEESIRYITIVYLARYLDLRPGKCDAALDTALLRLRLPSLGDWVSVLNQLERYFVQNGVQLFPTTPTDTLTKSFDAPAMRDLFNLVSGGKKQRVSILEFLKRFVALRNQTVHYGGIGEIQATERSEQLAHALSEMFQLLEWITLSTPVLIRSIDYRGPQQFAVVFYRLVGTGLPKLEILEVDDPGILRPNYVYLWGQRADIPMQLTPIVDTKDDALLILSGVADVAPEYSSIQHRGAKYRCPLLLPLFVERAGFLLSGIELSRPINNETKENELLHWNVQAPVPHHFMGRETVLQTIQDEFAQRENQLAILVLHGLRGVGKTTVAVAYANRHRTNFDIIWWIRAETEATIKDDLRGLGERLGCVTPADTDADALDLVKDRLRVHGRVLLIYDNAIEADELRPYLPLGGSARVLITSNSHAWRAIARPVELEVWPPGIGRDYLIARTGRESERGAAEELSDALGGLPLAHEQAACYCDSSEITLSMYHTLFNKTPGDFLNRSPAAVYQLTVAKTFSLAIEAAVKRQPAAEALILYAALLAPEPIPLFLFHGTDILFRDADEVLPKPLRSMSSDEVREAVTALRAVGLIYREPVADDNNQTSIECFRLHRLVRIVATERLENAERFSALQRLVALLTHQSQKFSTTATSASLLAPHGMELLQVFRTDADELSDHDAGLYFDLLARLVIMSLRMSENRQTPGRITPESIATMLEDYYEIEPLSGAIKILLKNHKQSWPQIRGQLLKVNNYVLRYAMAAGIADECIHNPESMPIRDVAGLVEATQPLNEFEVGGYALSSIYSRWPELIEPSVLEKLAERPEYPGRAILGDLLLNLALRADGHSYEPTALVKSERFWKSKWDFIELHVAELMAAKAFMGHPISLTHVSIDPKIIKDKTESFHALKRDVETLLGSSSINGQVAGLLHDYFWLGQQPDRIREIESSIRDLNEDDARELIRLLFAHPIWVVSEAAASLVTSLIERNDRLVVVVSDLLQNENWRVRYGATETACWIRHIEPTLFDDSIDRFCRDPNPNMRGLCAENLFSVILNSGKQIRDNLLTQYNEQIRYWLLDEDCWVLEHIFRFFSTLHRKHVNVEPLLSAGVSRLFDDAPGWYHRFDRGQFLRHIEAAKRRIRVNN